MLPLGVLAHDAVLVERLLQPDVAAAVARSAHRARMARGRRSRGDEYRQPAVPRGVNGAAVVLRAHVHVRRGDGRFAARCGVTKRGIQAGVLMRDRDQYRRPAAKRARLGDRFLVEADLRSGDEKDMIDAARGHRRDERLAEIIGRQLRPGPRFPGRCRRFRTLAYGRCA